MGEFTLTNSALTRAHRGLARIPFSRVWMQIIQTSGTRMYGLLISLVVLSITARYLGPDGRGIVAAATGWVAIVAGISSLSLGQVVIYQSAGKRREEWLPQTFGTLIVVVGIVTLLGWGIVTLAFLLTQGQLFNHLSAPVLAIAFLALPFMAGADLTLNLLLALDSLRFQNLAQVIGSTVYVGGVLLLVVTIGLGIYGALVTGVLSQAIIVGLCLGFIWRQTPRVTANWKTARRLLAGGVKLHLNAIGTLLFTQASVLMVNQYLSSQDTGYYQLASQLMGVLQIVPFSVSMVAYTLVSKYGPDAAWPQHRRLLFQAIGLALVTVVVSYFLAPWIIMLLAGDKFLPAVGLFQLMLIGLVGMNLSIVMASQWIGRGFFLQAALFTFAIGALTVLCNYLLLPRYGVTGAAWSSVFVYLFSIVGNGGMVLYAERKWRQWVKTGNQDTPLRSGLHV